MTPSHTLCSGPIRVSLAELHDLASTNTIVGRHAIIVIEMDSLDIACICVHTKAVSYINIIPLLTTQRLHVHPTVLHPPKLNKLGSSITLLAFLGCTWCILPMASFGPFPPHCLMLFQHTLRLKARFWRYLSMLSRLCC